MFRICQVQGDPILISDPPLLNVAGRTPAHTPRTIVEVVTSTARSGSARP